MINRNISPLRRHPRCEDRLPAVGTTTPCQHFPISCSNSVQRRSLQMITKVFVRSILLGGLLAGVFVLSAMAEGVLLRSTIVGSNPNTVIGGVPSGGAPWPVRRGSAALNDDGRLRVEVRDLILPKLGNPG